ncbi:hypothetical protein C5S32_04855 [ANME-1 cluster archaeon GoMg1]|nr:hypothetical protein [ANME-1 cluster archaeon GoMg1]
MRVWQAGKEAERRAVRLNERGEEGNTRSKKKCPHVPKALYDSFTPQAQVSIP